MVSVVFSQSNGELQKKRQCQSSGVRSPGFQQHERGAGADGLL